MSDPLREIPESMRRHYSPPIEKVKEWGLYILNMIMAGIYLVILFIVMSVLIGLDMWFGMPTYKRNL